MTKEFARHLESDIEDRKAAHARMKGRIAELEELANVSRDENARLKTLVEEVTSLQQRLRHDPMFVARHLSASILRWLRPGSGPKRP